MAIAGELQRLVRAAGFSWAGLKAAFQNEPAFRLEVLSSLLLIPAAVWLGETGLERGVMIGFWLLVIVVELINSSIEAVVDRMGEERHYLAGRAKDMGSAAVLVAGIIAGVVWLFILFN
jgi:diacylglycerol kinase (ATP)